MQGIAVAANKCKKDGLCANICPISLIKIGEDGLPFMPEEKKPLCILCGHCQAVCPAAALTLDGKGPEDLVSSAISQTPSPELVRQFLGRRRSVRMFKDKPVKRADIEACLSLSTLAPTALNQQPVHWIIVEGAENVSGFCGLVAKWMEENEVYPGMTRAYAKGIDLILRGAKALAVTHADQANKWGATDSATSLAYFELAAQNLGLGSCWSGLFASAAKNNPEISRRLSLPEGHAVTGALMLGYPKYSFARIPRREPAKVRYI